MSTINYDKIVGRTRPADRYNISTVDDIDERRKKKQEESDDARVSRLVAEIGKKTAVLTPLNVAKVALKKSNLQQAKEIGIPASQAHKLDDVPDTSMLASTLAPAIAGLTALNQIRRTKVTEDLQNKQNDYYKKALMMGRQGQSFGSMAPGMAAMTTKNMMNASLNFGGMMSMYELMTKHKLTGLSTEPLSYGNPGLIAAKMFGGIPGLGSSMLGGAGHVLNGAGSLTGIHGLNSVGGDLVKTAAGFNPTMASILSVEGLLGGMGTVGIGLGANKLLQHVINKSPLNTSKTSRNKWNQQRYQFPSEKSHQAIQQYGLALASIKSNLTTGSITSGEAQQLATLEKIVFNTAQISDIYMTLSDKGRQQHNRGVNTMNYIDKNIKDFDMSGKDLGNLFDGRMNSAQKAFFSTIGFLNSAVGSTNIVSNLFKSMKGQATDESFWALREAKQGYDKDAPLKQLGKQIGQGLSATRLLYATNLKTLIGDSKDPALTAAVTSAMFLQIIAQKSSSSKNMLGELHRLEEAQDRKIEAKQNWFIDTIVKGIDKTLQKTPIIGALMPLVHTTAGIGKVIKGIYNFADNITDPNYANGFTGFFKDIRTSVIDSLRNDNMKSEETIRARLKITKKTKQDLVNDYFAGHFQNQMQELLELLGSQNERLYQDQYTGDFVTHDQAEKLRKGRARKLNAAMGQFGNPDGMMGMAGNWLKKNIFRVSADTLRESALNKFSHVKGMVDEFGNPLARRTSAVSVLSGMSNNINSWSVNNFSGNSQQLLRGIGILALASYKLFAGYLPYLKQIAECCPEKKNKTKQLGKGGSLLNLSSTSGTTHIPSNSNNTQNLISQGKINDRADMFFNTFFEHIPNITKILETMQKKDAKSGILKGGQNDPAKRGSFGSMYDWFFGDGPDGKRKSKWSKLKDSAKDRYGNAKDSAKDRWSRAKEYGKDKMTKAKAYGSKGFEAVKSGIVRGGATAGRAGLGLMTGGAMGLARGGVGLITGLASGIASVGALPALAIATVVAGAADFIFNDGKITKAIWNSVADSSFGKMIGEGIDYLKNGWSDLKTWISDGINNILTTISDSITGAFNGIKIAMYKGMSKIPGLEDYMNNKIREEESSAAANMAQRNDAKRQETDIKDMQDRIKNAKSESERLQIALSYKDKVSGQSYQESIDGILNTKMKAQQNQFGKSLTWQNMKDQVPGMTGMDLNKQDEFIKSYSELKSLKNSMGMSNEDKAGYQQVDEMIRKIKDDMRKEYDAKNPVNNEAQQKALEESLQQMKETNVMLTNQIQSIVTQSSTVNGVLLKGFTEQMQSISGNQANLSTMMNSTARLMQKPNTVILDTTVAKLIPAIN